MEIDNELKETLFHINLKLPNGKLISGNFMPDINMKDWYDSLEDELASIPSKFAMWSVILAEQRHKVDLIDKQVRRRRSKLCEQLMAEGNKNGVRVTKYMLDEMVEADDKMLELESRLMLEKRTLNKLWTIVDSLKMKSESLRSLAGFKKQELKDSR